MDTGHGLEDMADVHLQLRVTLQLVGQHVQQDLGIGIGVDLAQVFLEQLLLELVGIGEVAVVCQADAVG